MSTWPPAGRPRETEERFRKLESACFHLRSELSSLRMELFKLTERTAELNVVELRMLQDKLRRESQTAEGEPAHSPTEGGEGPPEATFGRAIRDLIDASCKECRGTGRSFNTLSWFCRACSGTGKAPEPPSTGSRRLSHIVDKLLISDGMADEVHPARRKLLEECEHGGEC